MTAMSPSELKILSFLEENGPHTAASIAKAFYEDKSVILRHLGTLRSRGMVGFRRSRYCYLERITPPDKPLRFQYMTLQEAANHIRERGHCSPDAEERCSSEQLAMWLEELDTMRTCIRKVRLDIALVAETA